MISIAAMSFPDVVYLTASLLHGGVFNVSLDAIEGICAPLPSPHASVATRQIVLTIICADLRKALFDAIFII